MKSSMNMNKWESGVQSLGCELVKGAFEPDLEAIESSNGHGRIVSLLGFACASNPGNHLT
jgi:hypothetical protein